MLHNYPLALCIIRILLGGTFLLHGTQKVLGLFGGQGLAQFAAYTSSLGYPAWAGYAAAIFELIGGLMVLLGIYAELGAALTIPVMLVAIYSVHFSHGYFIQNGGFEYSLNLIVLALAIIIGGPGAYTLI